MNAPIPATALQLRSLVQADGTLQVSLEPTPVPTPGADEVLIQMQATPINPSDIGLLFGPADLSTVQVTGTAERPWSTPASPNVPCPAWLRASARACRWATRARAWSWPPVPRPPPRRLPAAPWR